MTFQQMPKTRHICIQMTKTSSSCRTFDFCQLRVKEGVAQGCYGATKSAEGGGRGDGRVNSIFDMGDHFSLLVSNQQSMLDSFNHNHGYSQTL